MATAMAGALSHQLPPIHLPQVPRVRPPRMLPGTPHPNNSPQPDGPVSEGDVWVQGRWRNQASNAAKQQQHVISKRVKRALKHETHGMNIYAYKHIRSSQVVYSLTRIMESGQIMPQLIYHGKKTVPAALRRDVWRPYFSVHFPETPAGARAGLTAYHRLRQFALRRQLDPPAEHLIATEKDYDKALTAGGDPVDVREKRISRKIKLPMIGQRLPKRMRAKKLMDQKATSVADLAFVLKLARRSLTRLQKESEVTQKEKDKERFERLGKKGIKRLKAIRREEGEEEKEIAERQSIVETVDATQGQMPLEKKVAAQLSIEYDGAVADSNRVIDMAELEGARGSSQRDANEIQVLWADIRDGTYAQEWYPGVYHQELQPVVTSKRAEMRVRQHEAIDEEGYMIDEQRGPVSVVTGSSPHIIGREKPPNYKSFQEELREKEDQRRELRAPEAARFEDHLDQQNFTQIRAGYIEAADSFDALVSDPTFIALAEKEAEGAYLDPDARSQLEIFQARQYQLLNSLRPMRRLDSKYPDLAANTDLREYWEICSEPKPGRLRSVLELKQGPAIAAKEAGKASKIQQLQNQLEFLHNQFAELQRAGSLRELEHHSLKHDFRKTIRAFEATQVPLPTLREQAQDTAFDLAVDPKLAQLDEHLNSASEESAALDRELASIEAHTDDDISNFTPQARDKSVPPSYSTPVSSLMSHLQSLREDLRSAEGILDDVDEVASAAEVYTIAPDNQYLKDRDRLQAILDARQEEIDQIKQDLARQLETSDNRDPLPQVIRARATTTSRSAAETVANTPSLSTPDSPTTADTLTLPTQAQLKDKLSALRTAQTDDFARLEELKDAEVAKFANSPAHINVQDLLPKSYRDPKYWADEPEDEAERLAREERENREWKAAREEQEREEAVKREEQRGLLARLGQRVGGVFRRRKMEA